MSVFFTKNLAYNLGSFVPVLFLTSIRCSGRLTLWVDRTFHNRNRSQARVKSGALGGLATHP